MRWFLLIFCCCSEIQGSIVYNNYFAIPKYPWEFNDMFASLFPSKFICIWNPTIINYGVEKVLKEIHKLQSYSVNHVKYSRTGSSNITQCTNNIVFNFDVVHRQKLFVDGTPSRNHVFLIIDTLGTNAEEYQKRKANRKYELFKIFWVARVILMTQHQVCRLSSSHFPPRRLERVSSLAGMEDEKVTDLKGRVVNIATFNCSLFSILKGPMNSGAHDGIEMRMMQHLAIYLNMTPNYIDARGWGWMFDNGTWNGGLTGMLQDGRAEIGFCNIWNTLRYNNLVGLGPPWNQMYHTFIVPRPIMVHGYWTTITTLFQRTVWVLLLIIFLLVTIIFSKYKISSENTLSGIADSILTVFGIFLGQSHQPPSYAFGQRIILSWSIFSYFMASILNNMMISGLMVPHQAEKIDTVKDFVQAGYLWGEEAYSNFQQEVYFDLENPWHKKMEQKFQAIPSRKMPAALKSHKIAFPAQRLGQEYVFIVQRSINRSDVSMFRLMKEPVNQFYVSMIFSKLSPILEISQYPLLRFFETGLILHWKNEVIRNYGSPEAARLLTEPSGESLSEFEPLTIDNNLAAFQILLYGLCGSLAVFSLELFSRKKSRVRMLKKEKRTDLFEPYFYCE